MSGMILRYGNRVVSNNNVIFFTSENVVFNIGDGFNNNVYDGGMLSNGEMVFGGSFTTFDNNTRRYVNMLNPNGTEKSSFYTNLTSTGNGTSASNHIYVTKVLPDDSIILGGRFTSFNGLTKKLLIKFNADGTEDTTFYTNLTSTGNGSGLSGSGIYSMDVYDDGRIILGGIFSTLNGVNVYNLVRLNADGTPDNSFNNYGTGNGNINTLNTLSNNDLLMGGTFTTYGSVYLVSLDNNGNTNTTFMSNLGSAFNNSVDACYVQSDGKILVGGNFTTLNGQTRNKIVRLNSDGTEDTTFYTNLTSTGDNSGLNNPPFGFTVQSDGKILVGGSFVTLNGQTRNKIVRLNSDGTEDTTFYTNLISTGDNSGLNNSVSGFLIDSNGYINVMGYFSRLNNLVRNGLIKLLVDGTEVPLN